MQQLLEYPLQLNDLIPVGNHVISNDEVAAIEQYRKVGRIKKVDPESFANIQHVALMFCIDGVHAFDKLQYFARLFRTVNGRPADISPITCRGGALIFAPMNDLCHFLPEREVVAAQDSVRANLQDIRLLQEFKRCDLILATGHRLCGFGQHKMNDIALDDSIRLLKAAAANIEDQLQVPVRPFMHFYSSSYNKRRKMFELE